MHDQLAEKFAALFAKCAATGDTTELRKEAAAHSLVKAAINPLLAGAIGAVGGGGAGYIGTEKKKNKLRNALYGALTGGLGSAGGALAYNSLNGPLVSPPNRDPAITTDAAGKLTAPKIIYDLSSKNPDNPISKRRPLIAAGPGAAGGAFLTGKALDGTTIGRRLFGGEHGYGRELDRLAKLRGDIKNPYSAVAAFLDSARRGKKYVGPVSPGVSRGNSLVSRPVLPKLELPAAPTAPVAPIAPDRASFKPGPLGDLEYGQAQARHDVEAIKHHSSSVAHQRALDQHNADAAKATADHGAAMDKHRADRQSYEDQVRRRLTARNERRTAVANMGRTGSLGDDLAGGGRERNLRLLERGTGTEIATRDLRKAKGFRLFEPGRGGRLQAGRTMATGAGGLLGGFGTDLLIRALQNSMANSFAAQQK